MRPTRTVTAAILACVALGAAAAGCGGGDDGDTTSAAPATTAPATTAPATATAATTAAGGDATAGKVVFTTNCGGCHTLADAGTQGQVGPNLDDLKPTFDQVQAQVTNGGGGMPAFGGQLSDQQIADVAAYVSESAGQ